jgi:hypothetical protein
MDNLGEPEAKPAIWAAIVAVMDEVTNIPKTGEMRGKNGAVQYNFVPSSELRARIGKAFRNHALMLQSRDMVATFEGKPVSGASGSTVWTTAQVTLTYVFTSLLDGSTLEFQSAGEGRDSSDKATTKAMTMALKSALSQAFMLATDDEDPDAQRPEITQDQRYAPAPPDNRTPEQRAAQAAYEARRTGQQPDAAQRAEAVATAPHPTGQPARQALELTPDGQRVAAQVHPEPSVQRRPDPTADPIQQAEQMLADKLGARPVDEIGQRLVTVIADTTRERMAGRQATPRDQAQRDRAGKAVQAAIVAPTLEQIDRVVALADTEGLLPLTIQDGKMVAAMLKAARDSRLAAIGS